MDADSYAVRTLSGRTDAQRAHSRAGHIGRADAVRKDHPLVRLLRPADSSALWPGQPAHRVDRALTVLECPRPTPTPPASWLGSSRPACWWPTERESSRSR